MTTQEDLDDDRVRAALGRLLAEGDPYTALPLVNPLTNLFPNGTIAALDTRYKTPTDTLSEAVNEIGTDVEGLTELTTEGRLSEDQLNTAYVGQAPEPSGLGAAVDTARLTALADAALAAGGGVIRLREGTYQITSAGLPVHPGVTYEGIAPVAKQINNVTLQWLADGPYTIVGGTILQGPGSGAAFSANTTPHPTKPANIGETEIPGFHARNLAIQGFTDGIHIGAENQIGLTWGSLKNIYISDCSGWGINLVNFAHMEIQGIFTQKNGSGQRYATHLDLLTFMPANSIIKDLYDTPVPPYNTRSVKGIWFESLVPSDGTASSMNLIEGHRIQSNRFNVPKLTVSATLTSGSSTVTVPDGSQFEVGFVVCPTSSVGGLESGRSYVVRSVSGNDLTLSQSYRGAILTMTASGSVSLETFGYPSIFIGGTTPGALVQSCTLLGLDSEGDSPSGVWLEGVRQSHFEIPTTPTVGNYFAAVVARDASGYVWCPQAGVTDFDNNSAALRFDGGRTTVLGRPGVGVTYDNLANSGVLSIGGLGNGQHGGSLHSRQGGMVYPTVGMAERIRPRNSAITFGAQDTGVVTVTGSGAVTFTLPVIATDASSYSGSNIGAWYEIVVLGSGTVTVQTQSGQEINKIGARTSHAITTGNAVRFTACKDDGGVLYWLAREVALVS